MTLRKGIILAVVAVFVVPLLIQFVPVWLLKTNPPVTTEPKWDSEQTRALAKRACFDCHSNETLWPWYSNIAPVSWLIIFDTQRGRNKLNFSEWGSKRYNVRELDEVILEGGMPPPIYVVSHSEAMLTTTEKQQLIKGLTKSLQ